MALDSWTLQRARTLAIVRTAPVLALSLFAMPAFAGKLSRASEAARSSSSSTTSSESTVGGSSSSSSDDVVGPALLYVIASPWLVPHVVVEDGRPDGAAARVRFAAYPYAEPSAGLLLEGRPPPPPAPIDPDVPPDSDGSDDSSPRAPAVEEVAAKKWAALDLGIEEGIGVDEGVVRSGFHARAQFPFRLGLDTSWSLYREGHGERVERLGLGREHLSLRFAESSRVHFQTGIGPQHLVDSQGWVHGFDVTWGFQAFPANPLVFAAEGSLGSLGNAFAPGVRGEIGLMLNRVEVSAGFEERWVGPVALGGPFVSITVWL